MDQLIVEWTSKINTQHLKKQITIKYVNTNSN